MERIICLIIGYLTGSVFQAGYWYGRFKHIDIREHGSGNAGTTNVMRTLGKKAGLITYFIDTFKAVFAAVIVHFIFGKNNPNEMLLFMYSGLGIVLGHNFPFYLNFKGGKGIAATSGVVASLFCFPKYCWLLSVLGLSTFGLVTYLTKYVSVGSLTAITAFLIELILYGSVFHFLPLEGAALYEMYLVVFAMTALGYIRHIGNIKRLMNGTERKIGQKRS